MIKNKRVSWRFKNDFVYNFFGRKYLANSLVTFDNNESDFEDIEKKYINLNNLIITHQVIIPKSEIQRLLNKFDNDSLTINPEIIILDKISLLNLKEIKNNDFCNIFDNESYIIFVNKRLANKC